MKKIISSAPIAATMKKHNTLRVEKYLILKTTEKENQCYQEGQKIPITLTLSKIHDTTIIRRYKSTKSKLKIDFVASCHRILIVISKISAPIK